MYTLVWNTSDMEEENQIKVYNILKIIFITLLFFLLGIETTNLIFVTQLSRMEKTCGVNNSKFLLLEESAAMNNPFYKKMLENNHHSGVLFPFYAPFRLIVAGPSESGKTTFVKRLLDEHKLMVKPPPTIIKWFFNEYQSWFDNYARFVHFQKGMPDSKSLGNISNQLIVIDDLFQDASKDTVNLFTVASHHKNISIIFITQNFFQKGGHQRSITLNASHVAFFKNPRDRMQIYYLAKQMYPKNAQFLIKAYEDATISPYSYLLIDLTQKADDRYRVRSKIFFGEYTRIYQPAKS